MWPNMLVNSTERQAATQGNDPGTYTRLMNAGSPDSGLMVRRMPLDQALNIPAASTANPI